MPSHSAPRRISTHPETPGTLGRAAARLHQIVCGLHGHDSMLHFERGRVSLLCSSCGHETPGWDVGRVPGAPDADERVRLRPFVEEQRAA